MSRVKFDRILVIRNDKLGDLILTLPTFEAIRRNLPKVHLAALVSPYAAPLLSGNPHISELIYDDPKSPASDLASRIRKRHFDAALVIYPNTRNSLAVWLSGIRQRVMWGRKPAGLVLGNRHVWKRRSHPPIHESEFALEFARRLGLQARLRDTSPTIHTTPAARVRAAARLDRDLGHAGPLFGLHPGSHGSAFNWPAEQYGKLAAQLATVGRVAITGAPHESPLLHQVREQVPAPLRSKVACYSDLTLEELIALLEMQTSLTVSSTGPMHMAAVVGTPVVALFSAHPLQSPEKWAPLGKGHIIFRAPLLAGQKPEVPVADGVEHMLGISLRDVYEANIEIALSRRRAAA